MELTTTLTLMATLLAVLAALQSAEFQVLGPATADTGVWQWRDLEKALGHAFAPFLSEKRFRVLNIVRTITAAIVIVFPNAAGWGLAVLLVLHVLTLLRWLGTFNGGSDYMNLLLLWTTTIALFSPDRVAVACLWYVALQLSLSYFRAGWVKIKARSWRSGLAVRGFLNSPVYQRSPMLEKLTRSSKFNLVSAWGVMFFELTFPLSFLDRRLALGYMALGAMFHLSNAVVFGLNRFFFAWLAAYPALYYCCTHLR